MRTPSLIPFTLLITLTACGTEPPPTPADQYAVATREVADAWCAAIARCCDAAELSPIAAELGFASPDGCSAAFVAKAAAIEDELRAGVLQLDLEAMAGCRQQLAAATCDGFAAIEATCARVVRGAIVDGGACVDDAVCASGWCTDAGEDSPRTCTAVPALGAPCAARCAVGAFCQPGSAGLGTCVATRADGATCDVDGQCASGRCDGATPAAGVGGVCSIARVCDGA